MSKLSILAASVALVSSASAATVLVDFNQANDGGASKKPDSAGHYWNTITGSCGSITSTNPLALIDMTNALTGISLQLTLTGGVATGFAGAGANDTDTGATVTNPLLKQAFAYSDGLFANTTNNQITLNFTGLAANQTYDFSLYGGRDSGGVRANLLLETGSSLIGDTVMENQSEADFNITSDASGVIAFNFASTGNNALLNAIAFTPSNVPEPSTYGLLGAGALALVSVLRRRKRPVR